MRRPARALARVGPVRAWGVARDHALGVRDRGAHRGYALGGYNRGRGRGAAGAGAGGVGATSSSTSSPPSANNFATRPTSSSTRSSVDETRRARRDCGGGFWWAWIRGCAPAKFPLPSSKTPETFPWRPIVAWSARNARNRSSTRLRVPARWAPAGAQIVRRPVLRSLSPTLTSKAGTRLRELHGLSFVLASAQDQPLGAALGIIGIACGRILDGPHHELPASMMSECPTVPAKGATRPE